MKRTGLILLLVFAVSVLFAQRAARTTAYNYLKDGKLAKAKENIDKACSENSNVNDDAKTWFYKGNIYYEIAISDNEEYQKLSENPLEVAFEAYKKAMELDEKDRLYANLFQNFSFVGGAYYNKGVQEFNNMDFVKAAKNFKQAYDVKLIIDIVDTAALFNAAVSAFRGQDTAAAYEYYTDLYELEYDNPGIYENLANIAIGQKDYEKAQNYINEGREKYPENYGLMIADINLNMQKGNREEAIAAMNAAIEKDPQNYSIYFAMGNMHDEVVENKELSDEERNKAFDAALQAYENAIEIKEDYADAYINIGALYVNKAIEFQNAASDLPLDKQKEYEDLIAKADTLLKKALPYLEKAYELEPNNRATIITLKDIYTRNKQLDKAKELNMKLQEME